MIKASSSANEFSWKGDAFLVDLVNFIIRIYEIMKLTPLDDKQC